MATQAEINQNKWREYFAITRKSLCEHFSANDVDWDKSDVFKKHDTLNDELAEMVDSIEFFGGIDMLKRYAALGIETENPDRFNKEIVSNSKPAELPLI